MSGYILALDQGTTSSRAILYDDHARPIKMVQQPTILKTPQAGFVEQDAQQIWQTQISCAHDVINQAGLLATDVTSIAITNQRESIVVWDKKTGKPLAPAIIWQDRRTASYCKKLTTNTSHDSQSDISSDVQRITGLRLDPYFSASKIAWLLEHNPKWRARIDNDEIAVGTIDSWLIYKLTGGEHVIDVTNASRTLLYDINKMEWSEELCARFAIPMNLLPKVLPSDGDFGKTKKGLFAKQIPIHAVLGDQHAALFGQGCLDAGMAKNTYGTGCFLLMNIGTKPKLSEHKLLTTIAWQKKSASFRSDSLSLEQIVKSGRRMLQPPKKEVTYALEGSVFMAGAIVQWLRDNLGMIQKSDEIEQLARQVDSSEDVVLLPAFTGLGAPYWRSDVSASITGMSRGTTKAHIARAALEAVAYQTYDVLIAMQKDSPHPLTELRVDGGAANNDLLMQFQADLLNVPVLRPKDTEVTAKGVALLAGLKTGLYDEATIQASWQVDRIFEPQMSNDMREQHLSKWQQAIDRALIVL
ncbi:MULTISPECIES: glycerol kinase GlpK [Psychrobacter]|uniref:ATP:glycerol 3-phosphotransferase n=1 Tax=Psychrobacter alimentarius TaxID=261164 RepID=A0ABM5ZX55_9GAMM|nr:MULTISPECIES: glycerol kinase GlpK [Psychrobacter]AMT96613.1 Glycerol kinase [Psychrobacter alimentarius]QCB31006.1 glycerol kinase [Psychrobacter sp. PAMC27889]